MTIDRCARVLVAPEIEAQTVPTVPGGAATVSEDRVIAPDAAATAAKASTWTSGTSMSAPHITGVIALMLHTNPNLTHVQIQNLLVANSAAKPADSTPDKDPCWRARRLNAKKAVDAVAQMNPPVAKVPHAPQPLALLQQRLLTTERAPTLQGLFEKYFGEVTVVAPACT